MVCVVQQTMTFLADKKLKLILSARLVLQQLLVKQFYWEQHWQQKTTWLVGSGLNDYFRPEVIPEFSSLPFCRHHCLLFVAYLAKCKNMGEHSEMCIENFLELLEFLRKMLRIDILSFCSKDGNAYFRSKILEL